MWFLFLFVWILYFWVYSFLSYKITPQETPFLSLFFLFFWIIMFLFFSKWFHSRYKKKKDLEEDFDEEIDEKKTFWERVKEIIFNYSYYFWLLFLYLSIYFIASYYKIEFNNISLFINICSLILFFWLKKEIFFDFLKASSVISAFILIFLSYFWNEFWILNFIIILVSLFVLCYEFNLEEDVFWLFFVWYLLSFLSIWSYFLFWDYIFLSKINLIFILYWIIFFFLWKSEKIFVDFRVVINLFSIVFLYLSWIISWYLIFSTWEYYLFLILILSWFFNLWFHIENKNYVSFFFSISSVFFLFYYLIFSNLWFSSFNVVFSWIIFPFIIFLSTLFFKFRDRQDIYFLHFFWYVINIFSVLYYFFNISFDLLKFWVIMLIESVILFSGYYILKNK